MSIAPADLDRISNDIWAATLGLELAEAPPEAEFDHETVAYTGQVQLTGAWTGAVLVELSGALAATATATMFGLDPGEAVDDDDVADTVGELANMTGGNVKALLPSPCALSLPSVTVGCRYRVAVPGSKVVERLRYHCEGELLALTVLEGAPQ